MVGMRKSIHSKEQAALRQALKQIRGKAGFSQTQLAEKLGKPQSFVSKYESGERRLDFLEVREICAQLEIDIDDFGKLFERFLGESQ